MKTNGISLGIIFLLVAMVCTTCTKDEDLLTPEGELSTLKGAKVNKYIPDTDITDQLRNDIEAGLDVTLPAGHFYLSETILTGYLGGTIKGAGKNITIIEAAPGFKSLPNPGGALVSCMLNVLATGDLTIKAMTFIVSGDHPAEEHFNPWTGSSTNIDNVIVIRGIDISAIIKDIKIIGEYVGDIEGAYNGYNISFPLIGVGLMSPKPLSLEVKDCEIEGSGGPGIEFYGSDGGSGEIKDNIVSNTQFGVWLGPRNVDSDITVKDNEFQNIALGAWAAIFKNPDISNYCFKDNALDGEPVTDDCQL